MRQRQFMSAVMGTVAVLGVVVAGSVLLGATAASAKTAKTTSSLTSQNMTNAKLPAGVCSSGVTGVPRSGAIQLSKGSGTVGTMDSEDYFGARILDAPVSITLGADRAGLAVVIVCGQGGSDEWSSMWVFKGSPSKLTTLFGGITPRSYAQGAAGSQLDGLRAKGHTLIVQEAFSKPGDTCLACSSGKLTTTWGWAPSDKAHLVITQPRPKKAKVVVTAAPTAFLSGPASLNQAGSREAVGRVVLATCTAQPPASSLRWTELDTGAWLPSSDLQSVTLPDCDGGAAPLTATTTVPPPTTPTTTTPTTGEGAAPPPVPPGQTTTTTAAGASSAPCTAAAITPAAVAGLSGSSSLDTFGCSGDYAYAGVVVSGQPGQEGGSDEITRILIAVNGAWQIAPADACTAGSIPAAIFQIACNSN
jgi:hypothetical protein